MCPSRTKMLSSDSQPSAERVRGIVIQVVEVTDAVHVDLDAEGRIVGIDQKRLVRGEHWLAARNHLRIRDRAHHRSWQILIPAGGAPEGEIGAIHAVMPRAHIVAVDRDEACVEAARRAGADEAIRCDLLKDIVTQPGGPGRPAKLPAEAIMRSGPYDAISLDLCAGISDETKTVFEVYRRSASRGGPLTARGVVILTFSYGRD